MIPDLRAYHWLVANSSGGKDSQAMLDYVVELADAADVPRGRLVVAHADLGRVEWPGTRELAEEQARHYGLEFVAVSRPQGDLLEHIAQRVRMSPPGRVPQDLYGAWKGKFPEDLDVDGVLREARAEWEKAWTDDGDFVG